MGGTPPRYGRGWRHGRWRRRGEVVAIDPSAPFRSAVHRLLPKPRISVDHFHLVKLGNDAVTAVRRRVSWDHHDRRGRKVDPAWAHRLLLLRGYGTLSARGKSRLAQVLAADDPTDGIGAAWGRQGAAAPTFCLPHPASRSRCPRRLRHLRRLGRDARDDSVEEDHRGWWPAIETFIHICATNARTEATNVTTKTI
ncbi:MAG: transposase [Actinomycetota bacterium]|nr:transposase [Actinomycetota bacterium]